MTTVFKPKYSVTPSTSPTQAANNFANNSPVVKPSVPVNTSVQYSMPQCVSNGINMIETNFTVKQCLSVLFLVVLVIGTSWVAYKYIDMKQLLTTCENHAIEKLMDCKAELVACHRNKRS